METEAVEVERELSRHEILRRVTRSLEFVRSPTVICESQLIGGENIGATVKARHTAKSSNKTATTFSPARPSTKNGDDDDGGGGDPDPERKPHSRNKRPFAGLPDEGYVRLKQVLEVIPVSKSTWWNGVREGRFPRSTKLGPRTTVWLASDIRKLIEETRCA